MDTTTVFDKVSAAAVSAMIRRAGFKRAAKKGYSTGFSVEGVGTAVYVYYQESDPAAHDLAVEEILALFNSRPGYSATFEVPVHMVGIDDSKTIHIRRPIQVVDVQEVPFEESDRDEEVVEAELVATHPLVSVPRFRRAYEALSELRKALDSAPEDFFTQLFLDTERTERNIARDADDPEEWTLQIMYLVPGESRFTRIDVTFFAWHQGFCSGITYEEFHGIQAIVDHIRFALVEH